MAVLVTPDDEEVLLEIGEEPATIGRSKENALCLRTPKVSLSHARIEPTAFGYILIDLSSTNGTYLNGVPIQRERLKHGDKIRFGPHEFIFRCEEAADTLFVEPELTDEDEDRAREEGGEPEEHARRDREESYREENDDERVAIEEQEEAEEEEQEEDEREDEVEDREEREEDKEWEAEEEEEEDDEDEDEDEDEKEYDEVEEVDENDIEVEVEPDQEEEYDLEVHYRRRLRTRTMRRRARNAAGWALLLLISLFIHFESRHILNRLSLFGVRSIEWKRVEFETDFVMIVEERPAPRVRRDFLDILPPDMQTPPDQQAAEELPKVVQDVPPIRMASLDAITELDITGFVPVREFKPDQSFSAADASGALSLSTSERARTFSDQLDDFAMEMINVLVEEPLHVVLIFDRSYSLEDDREYMKTRLDHIIELLGMNLRPTERARLKWSVVGFGDMARIYLSKSEDADKVRDAISKIANDKSGVENLLAALSYSLKMLDTGKGKTFFVVVTDEVGDDTTNDENVALTLRALLKREVAVHIFGAEANFSCPIVQGIGIDRATGKELRGDVNAGPESAYSEFFEPDKLFQPIAELPSGYGMYVQSRLSAATGGRYYMLEGGVSKYNPDVLPDYAPELCSREEYLKRQSKSKLRKLLAGVLEEWPKLRPDAGVNNQAVKEEIKRHIDRAQQCDAFCQKAIKELQELDKSADKEKYQPKRWQANYDLGLATLCRDRFLLGDYLQKLKDFGNNVEYSKDGQPLIGFRIVRPPGPMGKLSKEMAERADMANRYLVRVMEHHPKTPWDAMARLLRGDTRMFRVVPFYRPKQKPDEERPKRPPETEPPKL